MRYMMFIKHTEDYANAKVKHTEDYANAKVPASLYEAMGTFIDEASKKGQFVGGAGLLPTAQGSKVKLRGGKITITDGPFTESKEIVGGYPLMDAASKEEALDLARRFLELHQTHWPAFEGECEVRPLEEEVQPKS